jgi:hypothetical protein
MKSLKLGLLILGSIGILLLSACSNNEQAANSDSNSTNSTPETATKTETTTETGHSNKNQGGQVVESGAYHLEFVPETEASGTHMDFFLQRGNNHEAIPNAKVTAQVQLPDGTQKTLPLTYDAQGKHYTALLPGKASGQYQVKIISDIKGKKVDGRFSFNQ